MIQSELSLDRILSPKERRGLELLQFKSKRSNTALLEGRHGSNTKGFGIEFAEYRSYEMGDNPKYIDWNHYAKSEKLYIKRFSEEKNLSLIIFLDTSASVTSSFFPQKWSYTRKIAIALCYIGLMGYETVSVVAPGSFISLKNRQPSTIHSIAKGLFKVTPNDFGNHPRALLDVLSKIKRPTGIIFLSDFMNVVSDTEKIISICAQKQIDLSGIQILSENDTQPAKGNGIFQVVDSETGEELSIRFDKSMQAQYNQALDNHCQQVKRSFTRKGFKFTTVKAGEDILLAFSKKFKDIGILQ